MSQVVLLNLSGQQVPDSSEQVGLLCPSSARPLGLAMISQHGFA